MDYRGLITKLAQETPAGSFMIKVEVPTKHLNTFRDEYKKLKGMGRFTEWDFNQEDQWKADKVFTEIKGDKYTVEYRVFFNASPEDLALLEEKYPGRIKRHTQARGEYLYHIDDNELARTLIKNGAVIGRNNFPMPL